MIQDDEDNDLDLGAHIPAATFNRVAFRKPFNESKTEDITERVLRQKKELALETRCKECGAIKEQRKEGQGKFRFVCVVCKTRKRTESDRKKRNEARKPNT